MAFLLRLVEAAMASNYLMKGEWLNDIGYFSYSLLKIINEQFRNIFSINSWGVREDIKFS